MKGTLRMVLVSGLLAVASAGQSPVEPAPWAVPDLGDRLDRALGLRPDRLESGRDTMPRRRRVRRDTPDPTATAVDTTPLDLATATLLAAAVIALISFVGVWLWREREPGPAKVTGPDPRSELECARERVASDDPAGAVAACYRFAVQALRDHRVIPSADSLPDGLILRRLRNDRLAAPFARLSAAFQPMRYGRAVPDAADARTAIEAADELDRLLSAEQAA